MNRVGIFMPRSTLFPSIGLNFLDGFKKYLIKQEKYNGLQLLMDNISFGINEPEIYTKAEKMLLQEDVDMVIVFADIKIGELLQPLFTACNKILILVNMGANVPFSWQPAPTTISHTLNFSFCAWLTGKKVAALPEKECINLTSYYDGGYGQCNTMLTGHLQNGGLPRFNHVTHLKLNEFTLEPVIHFFENNQQVNNCLCLFSGEQAGKFYEEIPAIQEKYNLQLFGAPMLFDAGLETVLGNDFQIKKMEGFVPWHKNLKNTANNGFLEIANKSCNYFTLLGWETGIILNAILEITGKGITDATEIVKNLYHQNLESPRGWVQLDTETHATFGPVYWATATNNFSILLEENNTEIANEWKAFTATTFNEGESSGWKNTYLCI